MSQYKLYNWPWQTFIITMNSKMKIFIFSTNFKKDYMFSSMKNHKQAQATSVYLAKRASLLTMCHKKHKNSLHMACKNLTRDKRKQIAPMSNKMNAHQKCIPWVYLFIYYSYFAPLKYIHPISPKHNNFMDSSSPISPPLLSNAFMIISTRLKPNPFTTLST